MSFKLNIQGFEYWAFTFIGSVRNYRPVKADDFQLNWVAVVQLLDGLLLHPNEKYGLTKIIFLQLQMILVLA